MSELTIVLKVEVDEDATKPSSPLGTATAHVVSGDDELDQATVILVRVER